MATQLLTERLDERGFSFDHRVALLLAILCVAAISTTLVMARRLAGLSPAQIRRELRLGLARLPFGGNGSRFALLTFATTVAFAALACSGEPRPLLRHDDIGFWIFSGVLTAIVAAIVSWFAMRVAPELVAFIAAFFIENRGQETKAFASRCAEVFLSLRADWPSALFSRPPPPGL